MPRSLTLDLPEKVDRAIQKEAIRTGRSPEQVAIHWIELHVELPTRGSVEALMSSYGSWSMTPNERTEVERMIEEDRLFEEGDQ